MVLLQYSPVWQGARIGTGYTVLHFKSEEYPTSMQGLVTAVRTWLDLMANKLPNDVNITFPAELIELEEATGQTLQIIPVVPPAGVGGVITSTFAANAGRLVRWQTGQVAGGRRVIGHTYLVPSANCYTDSGNIDGTTISADQTAHTDFLQDLTEVGTNLAVYSRKNGQAFIIGSGATQSRPTQLRKRND